MPRAVLQQKNVVLTTCSTKWQSTNSAWPMTPALSQQWPWTIWSTVDDFYDTLLSGPHPEPKHGRGGFVCHALSKVSG